jgi:hypothetical protein
MGKEPIMTISAAPPGGREASPAAPASVPPARLPPARAWYWVALAVGLAGVAWMVLTEVALFGQINELQQISDLGAGRPVAAGPAVAAASYIVIRYNW